MTKQRRNKISVIQQNITNEGYKNNFLHAQKPNRKGNVRN